MAPFTPGLLATPPPPIKPSKQLQPLYGTPHSSCKIAGVLHNFTRVRPHGTLTDVMMRYGAGSAPRMSKPSLATAYEKKLPFFWA
jgi:hypothetical protein